MFKFVVVLQCENVLKRCSGFACTNSFYNKDGFFENTPYESTTRYISFSCGGCPGSGVSGKLEHFSSKLLKKTDIKKSDVVIHLSSCMVTENHHHDRCPFVDYIKDSISKKGYTNIIEGTYKSANAERKRQLGIYKDYQKIECK